MPKHLLEKTNSSEIRFNKKNFEKYLEFFSIFYDELARQRKEHWDQLKESLIKKAFNDYSFKKYCRIVNWEFS